ncbi:retrovirus-related pol polyprotein from transposon TNT 1-94 [Tanacetum coccineum]
MIPKPGDLDREVSVAKTFHEQTDEELTKKEVKQMEADDQAIHTILMDLPKDIYATLDSCGTAQEIWLRVQQMTKGSDIGIQEKTDKLFNEWESFTSTDGESIESYYHHFSKLMNDFKRNKHFPEKIANCSTEDEFGSRQTDAFDLRVLLIRMNQNGNDNVVAARAEGNGNHNENNRNQVKCYNCRGMGHLARNCTVRPIRRDAAYLQTQLLIDQKEEAGIQL